MVKNLPASAGDMGSIPGSRRSPGGGKPTLVFLPRQRRLVGDNPCGRKRVRHSSPHVHARTHTHTHTQAYPRWRLCKESACQCRRHKRCGFDLWVRKIPWRRARQSTPACLENPMDRGVGWAIVQGVPKRWTQLGMHTQKLTTFSIRHIIQKVGSPFCHPHKVVLFQISVWAIEIRRNGAALQTWLHHCKRPSFPLFLLMPQKL